MGQEETRRPLRIKSSPSPWLRQQLGHGRQVHLVNGCRGDDCRGTPSSASTASTACRATLRPTAAVGGEIRADVTLVVVLRFLARQSAQERGGFSTGRGDGRDHLLGLGCTGVVETRKTVFRCGIAKGSRDRKACRLGIAATGYPGGVAVPTQLRRGRAPIDLRTWPGPVALVSMPLKLLLDF